MSVEAASGAAATERLDVWLAARDGITRHAARTLIDAGLVSVNSRRGRAGQRVRGGDTVAVEAPPPVDPRPVTRAGHHPAQLQIVYEDADLAVVDKPAGLVVHPAPGHRGDTLADMLRERGSTWSLLGGEERPGIVHRLDSVTSGLMVVAKTEDAHRSLAAQLRDRTLGRTYTALVKGGFRETTGTIDAPIGRDPRQRKRMAVVVGGRAAITDFRVLERLGDVSVLDVQLRSGRTHQIRVHLAYIQHPVLGDAVYGTGETRLGRLGLHARLLAFVHPADGSTRTFASPTPVEFEAFLQTLRGHGG